MKTLVWNCQGLGGSSAITHLEEFCRLQSPDLVFLCETKNQAPFIRKVCRRIKFQDFCTVEPVGLSGGLALLWKQGTSLELESHFGRMGKKVTNQMNQKLMEPISEKEVRMAVFSMKTHSAPGPDGMTPFFYKHFYYLIKDDLLKMIQSFFHSGKMLKELNHTCISLIPKHPHSFEVTHFRPISLCNVSYRIISKILANRMKKVLAACISLNQSAFLSGRYITDNFILAHEILNFMLHDKTRKNNLMALKIDMAKAFDKVEWNFIRLIMTKMGFCKDWIDRVLECVSTTSFSFIINGIRTGFITPSRGLRQGDPISPYLFLICAEGLTYLLNNYESSGAISGVKLARNCPSISHLFFADDSLIICEANPIQATNLCDALNVYQACSGQQVNIQKSCIFFSKKSDPNLHPAILSHFPGISVAPHTKYLGLPLVIGRSKKEVFQYLKDKISTKLSSWKNNLLSLGGKEILLKSVITMLLSYPLSVFKIPNGICHELSSLMARFWWGNEADSKKGMNWLSWRKMCSVKGMGGLGFRDLEALNLAYLSRQIWRILKNPNLLVSKVLKAKYYPYCSIFEATKSASCSFFWKGIMSVINYFKDGIFWSIGNGESVRVWEDNWLPNNPSFKPITPLISSPNIFWVKDLIKNNSWDENKIKAIFWPVDANQILSLPISCCNSPDLLLWGPSPNGTFTLKSAYNFFYNKLVTNNPSQNHISSSSSHDKFWKILWSLNLPNKLKHFYWKCLKNILPCRNNLASRLPTLNLPSSCAFCNHPTETIEHILIHCPNAIEIWKNVTFNWPDFQNHSLTLVDWWSNITSKPLPPTVRCLIEKTIFVFWNTWKSRNNWVFNREVSDPKVVAMLASKDFNEYTDANVHAPQVSTCLKHLDQHGNCDRNGTSSLHQAVCNTSDKPALYIHTDAAWTTFCDVAGGGAAIFDQNYNLVEIWGRPFNHLTSPLRSEAEVVRWALITAKNRGLDGIHIKTDSQVLAHMVHGYLSPTPDVISIIFDIQQLLLQFDYCNLLYFKRTLNIISHGIAKFAKKLINPAMWTGFFPSWIVSLKHQEEAARNLV